MLFRSGRELEIRQGLDARIGLGDHSGQLRGGLDEQHPRKERLAGEMAAQKWLVTAHSVFTGPASSRFEAHEPIEKAEFRPMRQESQGFLQRIMHALWLPVFERLDHFIIRGDFRGKQLRVQLGIQNGVFKVIAHG